MADLTQRYPRLLFENLDAYKDRIGTILSMFLGSYESPCHPCIDLEIRSYGTSIQGFYVTHFLGVSYPFVGHREIT